MTSWACLSSLPELAGDVDRRLFAHDPFVDFVRLAVLFSWHFGKISANVDRVSVMNNPPNTVQGGVYRICSYNEGHYETNMFIIILSNCFRASVS